MIAQQSTSDVAIFIINVMACASLHEHFFYYTTLASDFHLRDEPLRYAQVVKEGVVKENPSAVVYSPVAIFTGYSP